MLVFLAAPALKDGFRLQNSPKTPGTARIRTVTPATPLPPGGDPTKHETRLRQVSYESIKDVPTLPNETFCLITLFPNHTGESLAQSLQNFSLGVDERLHCVPTTYLFSCTIMIGGETAANSTREEARE